MRSTKECISCGAQNDVIFTNCIFCNNSLPTTNYDLLTNEELVMKVGEWVSRASEPYFEIRHSNSNDWTGKGIQRIIHGEIIGNAQKYLTVLRIRAHSSPILNEIYDDLYAQFLRNKQIGGKEWRSSGGLSNLFENKFVSIIGMAAGLILVIGVSVAIAADHIQQGNLKKAEMERLNRIEQQITKAILNGNYDAAAMLVPQLRYSGPDIHLRSGQKKQDNYDIIRTELKSQIKNHQKNKNGNN